MGGSMYNRVTKYNVTYIFISVLVILKTKYIKEASMLCAKCPVILQSALVNEYELSRENFDLSLHDPNLHR